MSRKGVITKRVKTVQTALSREQRPNRAVRLAEERCSALGQIVRPTEVSAKVQTTRPITHHDPGNMSRGRPSHTPRHRARPKRASRETPRGRATLRVPADVRPSRENVPRPAEISSAKLNPLDHAGRP
ncbi:unnamed protein product [Microthlaspi erraticum]|uniref:Uncharacterized protein n=1 Tax=Microthlaspi erraticum TaxID=1685480 RepID=A0A6D2L111_9BRAS|nr:unnamed protein product [Microthlaspi erraticum]